ncbi:hypothetical protein CDES_01745 [Corynebacterium deserti GIMN1.010]|uniref:Uncharacterized protein n=1 Tax=Corynebacterium deserti GIMN1.010 TaxID=931089 RepID=A0A0M4CCA4_9CORY|nr:hypothetical protein CDES_01745 [Corynebacterium deserti GIMN1.010]
MLNILLARPEKFSPLRRGWSLSPPHHSAARLVLPAQAGMVRLTGLLKIGRTRSPRSGGDGPSDVGHEHPISEFSPLRRGWSHATGLHRPRRAVLPAQAGMVRVKGMQVQRSLSSPRSGGDGPSLARVFAFRRKFSPLRRGWSLHSPQIPGTHPVLPAQAGMVPGSLRTA